jgi:hypothetical protein
MQDRLDPITLFLTAFGISALAGVAALLRTSQVLSARALVSAGLNAGAVGMGIALVLFTYFKDNTWFLLGVCLLAGLGGMTCLGFILAVIQKGGVAIKVNIDPAESDAPGKSSSKDSTGSTHA